MRVRIPITGGTVFNKFFHILSAVKREPVNDTGLCNTEAGKIFFIVLRYQVSLWVLVQSLFFRAFLIPFFCHLIKRNTVGAWSSTEE